MGIMEKKMETTVMCYIGILLGLGQGSVFCTLRVCILGLGSLNRGIWPLTRAFGTENLRLQTLRVQT